jgi:hypothetical protein
LLGKQCGCHGRLKITDGGCIGVGQSWLALNASWRINYLLEEKTESGAASLVPGMYCDAISNALVNIVCGVILQDDKWVVPLCMLLVNGSQEMNVARCGGIM